MEKRLNIPKLDVKSGTKRLSNVDLEEEENKPSRKKAKTEEGPTEDYSKTAKKREHCDIAAIHHVLRSRDSANPLCKRIPYLDTNDKAVVTKVQPCQPKPCKSHQDDLSAISNFLCSV